MYEENPPPYNPHSNKTKSLAEHVREQTKKLIASKYQEVYDTEIENVRTFFSSHPEQNSITICFKESWGIEEKEPFFEYMSHRLQNEGFHVSYNWSGITISLSNDTCCCCIC